VSTRYYSTLRYRPLRAPKMAVLRPGFLNPFSPGQALTIYMRTGLRMSSAIIAAGITLMGLVFVALWFVTNIF